MTEGSLNYSLQQDSLCFLMLKCMLVLSDGFWCVTMSAFRSTVSIHEVLEVDHFGVM